MARSGYLSAVGLALATSANGTARTGAAIALGGVGGFSAYCHGECTTNLVAPSFDVQVSQDNSTWYDLRSMSNVANNAGGAGTGSQVLTDVVLHVPASALRNWKFIRVTATLAGASTGAADKTSVTYYYSRRGAAAGD